MKDKVVVITGASSGIGLACAEVFAAKGAKIVLAARDENRLKSAASRLKTSATGFSLSVVTDVSKENDCKKLIDETMKHFGRIDILINNAGISMRALFEDVDLKV